MIHVIASIKVKEDKVKEFIDIFKENVPNVLGEDGCIEYTPTVDLDAELPVQNLNGNRVMVIEKWGSPEALKKHLEAPHMIAYKERTKDLVESVSIKVLQEA